MLEVKRILKKYSYLSSRWFNDKLSFIKHRFFIKQPLDLMNVSTNVLPYPVDWTRVHKYKELYIEIGTGHGELISYLARNNPENLYVGFEISNEFSKVSRKKVNELKNALVFQGDGYDLANKLFKKDSISGVYFLFPDPWHKRKHHKRRPLVEKQLRYFAEILKENGFIFIATDWLEYYKFIKNQTENTEDLYYIETGEYQPSEHDLIKTHYYKKWVKEGRNFNYIKLIKRPKTPEIIAKSQNRIVTL